MSDTPPRRIAPQMGAHVWQAESLAPSDYMIPLGAEAAAEIAERVQAGEAGEMPVLAPVLHEIAERCDHGQGFVLLRGLPALAPGQAGAALSLLGRALGEPMAAPAPAGGGVPDCDLFLVIAVSALDVSLASAGAAHNALMLAERAGLERLYQPLDERQGPVFALRGGVFGGRFNPAGGAKGPLVPLAAVCAEPSLPLRVSLRAGDVLALNPFLVWPFLVWPYLTRPGQALDEALLVKPLRMALSRLPAPETEKEVGG